MPYFCHFDCKKPMSMLTGFQEKKLGDDTWPRGGVIKPESWCQLGGTYGIILVWIGLDLLGSKSYTYIIFFIEE